MLSRLLICVAGVVSPFVIADDIDFNDLRRPGAGLSKSYPISGVAIEAKKAMMQFDEIDTQRVAKARASREAAAAYAAENNQPPSGSKNSPVSSSPKSNSDAGKNAVLEIRDGGARSSKGFVIWKIRCATVGSYSVFIDENGWWRDGSGSNYGDKFKNKNIGEGASEFCRTR